MSRGGRVTPEQALELWDAPLGQLGALAFDIKRAMSGDKVFYNRNFHIEPTNICTIKCRFCSYCREADSPEAWDMSIEQIEAIARGYADSDVTEVHIVGAVHPNRNLEHHLDIIRRVKAILPQAVIKAFTAVELRHMITRSGLTIEQGLAALKQAGMEAIPGGGAEIFDAKVRGDICPEKGSAEQWLEVHDIAHRLGISTNATILYGHVESIENRIDHLERLRQQQDKSKGFNAFIPLKYRSANNALGAIGEVSIIEDLKMLAISRIYLDNFAHIKAYWPMYGKVTTELALSFGADDVDGTIDATTKIYSMAGAEDKKPSITIAEIDAMARRSGLRAVERDSFYNEITKI